MGDGLNKKTQVSDILCVLPVCVFVLSITLVRLHIFSMPLTDVFWTEATDTTSLSDLFGFWKCIDILAAGALSLIIITYAYLKDLAQLKKSFLYIPMLVYIAFVLVSLVFSKYEYFAVHGMQEHFEGTFVLLAYMLLLFFIFNIINNKRRASLVILFSLGITFLISILGVTQAIGHDFFSTTIGQKLITPNYTLDSGIKSWDMIDILAANGQHAYDFSFTEGEVYQTVYNINYVPLYLSLLIPVSAILFIFFYINESKKGKLFSAFLICLYGLLLYNFFSANSASGYLGLLFIFVGAFILFRKHLKKWLKPIICLILVLGLVLGITADRWLEELKPVVHNISSCVINKVYADNAPEVKLEYDNAPAMVWVPIDFILTEDNYVQFGINGEILVITRDESKKAFIFTDGDNNQLYLAEIERLDGWYQVLDDRFHDYIKFALTTINEMPSIIATTNKYDWRFCFDGEQFLFLNNVGKLTSLEPIPHGNVIANYNFASNRGRIWDTTLPLLKECLVKGVGADCFTFAFPQNDYVVIYNLYGYNNDSWFSVVTDKAHNIYLQYWVNTGLISLLAWLTMVGYYLVGAIKQFRKRGFVDFCDFVNGGIFCGICGFLAVAFFNDGSVNTMPMFYTMLGTGLAINMRDKWADENVQTYSEKKQPETMPEI